MINRSNSKKKQGVALYHKRGSNLLINYIISGLPCSQVFLTFSVPLQPPYFQFYFPRHVSIDCSVINGVWIMVNYVMLNWM